MNRVPLDRRIQIINCLVEGKLDPLHGADGPARTAIRSAANRLWSLDELVERTSN
jgi:hypothetical protein